MAIRFASCFLSAAWLASGAAAPPPDSYLQRVTPLGGMRGATVEVELTGENLAAASSVWFDTPALVWLETREAAGKKVRGTVRVDPGAALGPHLMFVRLKNGRRTNSRLFNVHQFPSVSEAEPNDPPKAPQRIALRQQVIHGYMEGNIDIDVFEFDAKAGERWTFDVRSLEYGSHLECDLTLEDQRGRRIVFNDDRDDYLETPFIDHTFAQSGTYRLRMDQYRGPQGVECETNCGYMLQISQLPVLLSAYPMGGAAGSRIAVNLQGRALDAVTAVSLVRVRAGEYYRLTFPYSIPITARPDPLQAPVIRGRIVRASPAELAAEFDLPADAEPGLWRVWMDSPAGAADGISLEIGRLKELDEKSAGALGAVAAVVNGRLAQTGESDTFTVNARAGVPLHFYTLAVQLGLPLIDTVLELFDSSGKLLAEHDDLMTGQGTVIGNPDSSLYFTPVKDEALRLVLRDRTGRGGPTYSYRLHLRSERPGFQLQTDPEQFTVTRGSEAALAALLICEPGFKEAVEIWVEGLPPGVTATKGSIAANQYFGPSDDGDNVIIPHTELTIRVPAEVAAGDYPVRVFGKSSSGAVVEAFTTMWVGPRSKRNDIRRPAPATTITVVDAP